MERGSLRRFYINELKKSHDAETQLVAALETLAQAFSSMELRHAFENHLEQTKDHATRLQMILEVLGEKSEETKSTGMKALIAEMQQLLQCDLPGAVLDSALLAYAQRIKHYEIAMYGTLRDYATAFDERDTASQLQNTLEEEQEANRLLTKIGQIINAGLARKDSGEQVQPCLTTEHAPKSKIKPAARRRCKAA